MNKGNDAQFIVKRLLKVSYTVFVMLIVYALMHSLPTSYVETKARELATRPGNLKSAAQWIEELNAQYGIDKGIIE